MAGTYTNTNHQFMCNASIPNYIANLTSSYIGHSNELKMASATTIMFTLTVLFFIINLFSTRSDINANLDIKVRYLLAIFLPVMSYLFSEAKYLCYVGYSSSQVRDSNLQNNLSQEAGFILGWMLLVEILRKKIDEIQMRGYSASFYRAGRVAWLGILVFFNIHSTGRKALFSILWIICATILVQRIVFTELGKRSYDYGKNARLMKSYLAEVLAQKKQETSVDADDVEQAAKGGDQLFKECPYLLTGEEKLVKNARAEGYEFIDITNDIVTVSRVWDFLEGDYYNMPTSAKHQDRKQQLKRLSLSFALFKQLRRRFEQQPEMTDEETTYCRNLIFKGLCQSSEDNTQALFQVMSDEVNFLSEYYHSVIPVVLASRSFFLMNYVIVFVVVSFLCFMTIVICGNGNVHYAFSGLKTDSFILNCGIIPVLKYLATNITKSPAAFFTFLDIIITVILIFIFIYEEIWEFIVFIFSNWFVVSLLCEDIVKSHQHKKSTCSGFIRFILRVRSNMINPALRIKQVTMLNLRWPLAIGLPSMLSLVLRTKSVPKTALTSITKNLLTHVQGGDDVSFLSKGMSTLPRNDLFRNLSGAQAWSTESVAEIILTWHIATSILEVKLSPGSKKVESTRNVATRLSKYCAYLVAFHPELLPNNIDNTERVFEDVKEEMKSRLGCFRYYFSCKGTRIEKIMQTTGYEQGKVVQNGATLAKHVVDAEIDAEAVWEALANAWTDLIIYVAPSSDEECIKGHEDVLPQGGEFITILWALTTHTAIKRRDNIRGISQQANESAMGGQPET